MTRWTEIIWNWPASETPYLPEEWSAVVEGLVASLRETVGLPVRVEPGIKYDLERDMPQIVFWVNVEPEQPLLVRMRGKCWLHTWTDNFGDRKIEATLSFQYFQDQIRLVAQDGTSVHLFRLVQTKDRTTWESTGWLYDLGEA